MAKYPLMRKNWSARTTTIIDSTTGALTSKASVSLGKQRITQDIVQDPGRLIALLNSLQDEVERITQGSNANPHSTPCIVRNKAATTGQVLIIRHTLGRAYSGWWVCRARGAQAEFYELAQDDPSYPAGLDQTQALVIVAGSTGTFDFCITGD